MSPVYKLSASSIKGRTNYGSMLAGNSAFVPPAFESIATVTVGSGGAATAEFTSIPNTYSHLQIRFIGRTLSANNENAMILRFNSDSGASSYYPIHYLYGDGSSAAAGANGSLGNRIDAERLAGGNATASIFGAGIIDILDYKDSNKYTTIRNLSGVDRNGAGTVWFNSGLWLSTSAITSIQLVADANGNFAQYSHFALYGCKI